MRLVFISFKKCFFFDQILNWLNSSRSLKTVFDFLVRPYNLHSWIKLTYDFFKTKKIFLKETESFKIMLDYLVIRSRDKLNFGQITTDGKNLEIYGNNWNHKVEVRQMVWCSLFDPVFLLYDNNLSILLFRAASTLQSRIFVIVTWLRPIF